MSVVIRRYSGDTFKLAADPVYERAPSVCDVMKGNTSAPWARDAFMDYVAGQYCSEVVDFNQAVYNYKTEYKMYIFSAPAEVVAEHRARIRGLWTDIVTHFVAANSPREINIPGTVRKAIVAASEETSGQWEPPSPDYLDAAFTAMLELMNGIFVQWIETVRPGIQPPKLEQHCPNIEAINSAIYAEESPEYNDTSDDNIRPFYKRAHGIWGSSRVHRHVRRANSGSPPKMSSIPDVEPIPLTTQRSMPPSPPPPPSRKPFWALPHPATAPLETASGGHRKFWG